MTRRLGSGFETNGSLVMLMWWPLAMIIFLESMFVIHCWVHTHNTKSYCLCSTDISCISPCSFCISHSNSGSLHWTTPHCTLSDQPTPHRWAKHLHAALVQCSAIVSGVLPNTTLCQTSFTNSFYAFTVIWVHFMYCLLQLVCNGLSLYDSCWHSSGVHITCHAHRLLVHNGTYLFRTVYVVL